MKKVNYEAPKMERMNVESESVILAGSGYSPLVPGGTNHDE